MSAEVIQNTSGLTGQWGKVNAASPCITYLAVGLVSAATKTLNPITGVLMATAASIVDIAASLITQQRPRHEDMYFRLGMTIVVPFTLAIAFGSPFPVAVTMTIIMFATRILLSEYAFKK